MLRRAGGATVVGIVGGVGLATLAGALLESAVFGLSELGAGLHAATAAILGVTALGAAYAPARRAARVDPVRAMRTE